MDANTNLSPELFTELARVYATLRPQPLSTTFLLDLEQAYSSLPVAPGIDFEFLKKQFDAWRQWAQQQIRLHHKDLPVDDPLLCPISLFRTMGYGRLETAHTRTLAWLLNPKGEHDFKETLLAALLRRLIAPAQFDKLAVIRVQSEHPIEAGAMDKRGRLDVFAEGQWCIAEKAPCPWTLVIEAKIDAWEGTEQLAKYDKWLNRQKRAGKIVRVLLTTDARTAETSSEDWKRLSFLDLVRAFRSVYNDLSNKAGFHFLRFYLAGVLQDVCRLPRNHTEDAVDPYAVLSYLKTVHDFRPEGIRHDSAW